jgi:hypothetical protein
MKSILIVIMFFYLSASVYGQRMFPKQKSIEINSGLLIKKNSESYFINTGITVFAKKGNYMLYSLEYSKNSVPYKSVKIPIENYIAEAGYSFNILANRTKNFMVNTSISAMGGYEHINQGEEMLYDGAKLLSESSFIYGTGAKLSLETYLSDRIAIIASSRARLLFKTSQNRLMSSLGIGIRINL